MYNIGDEIFYWNPCTLLEEHGIVKSKLKILDDNNKHYVDKVIYLVEFYVGDRGSLILEEEITGGVK